MKISVSKSAFMMLMGTACIAFLIEVWRKQVMLDNKDFMILASGAASFYFAFKGNDKQEFAGK